MLKGVERLLRHQAYEPILFSSAEAFKNHTDFDSAVCLILDINLKDGSGIELRYRLKADGVSVPVIYMTGNGSLDVPKAALDLRVHRHSKKAIRSAGADRAPPEGREASQRRTQALTHQRVSQGLCGPVSPGVITHTFGHFGRE
jgi:DNA-binding NtrC family response regulator